MFGKISGLRERFKALSGFKKWVVVATTILLVVILFNSKGNLGHLVSSAYTLGKQKKQIEAYRLKNAELDRRIESLSNDVDTLERYAREKFGFAEPGEDVYIVEN